MRPPTSSVNSLYSAILWLFAVGVLVLGNATNGTAQQSGVNSPARGFYPAGSYALSDLESISTRNGNVTMQVPLVSLPPGRGGLSAKLGLFYNSKLWESYSTPGLDMDGNETLYQYLRASPEAGWRYGLNYSLTLLNLSDYQPNGGVCSPAYYEKYYIYKLQMSFPDGSTHLFHSRAYAEYGGYSRMRPDGWQHDCSVFPPPGDLPFDSGTMVYYTDDGSYVRLEVAHDGDANWSNNPWTLYMPDGSRVTGGNSPQRIYDRNNNYVEITNTVSNNNPATEVVDQVGRALKIEYDSNNSRDYVTQRGTNNEELKWTLDWEYLPVYKTFWAVDIPSGGVEQQSATNESIYLVRRITLPVQAGSQTYLFSYNADPATQINGWGELRSMTLPSGAKVTYSYQYDGVDLSNSNIRYLDVLANSPTQKVLTYINEYDGATSPATETWTYNGIRDFTPGQTAFKTFERTSPDGGITRDRFLEGNFLQNQLGPYRVENPDGSIVERSYRDQALVGTPGEVNTSSQHPPHGNLYLKTEFRSVSNASGNPTVTAIKDYNYDKNGNLTGASEYDWVAYTSIPRDGSGRPTGAIPGGAGLKKTITNRYYNQTPDASETTSNDPSIYYNSSAPQLRIALAWNEVSDGAQTLARTELVYDNPSITGNVTQTTSWDSAKGSYSNPLTTNNSISTSTQYNQYGSPTLSTDPKGYQTQFSYGIVGAVIDLYPTQIKTAYGTSVQRTETREYDFYTGLVTLVTDADNNVATSTAYDGFGRPTLVRAAKDKPEETRSSTEYADTLRRVIVRSDLNSVGDGKLVSIQHYDQLGRVRLSRQLEDSATQSATDETTGIKVQTRYSFSGSYSYALSSNPYRAATSGAASSEVTMGWTRSKADNGGRTIEVLTFGGAGLPAPWGGNGTGTGAVTSTYNGSEVTVTDQAGKQRKSVTDGLGRLKEVYENPSSLNYLTSYSYDGLDNLTTVTQDVQPPRTFVYDSLKRLRSATNPESGTVCYGTVVNGQCQANGYDANGNLLYKTDGRGILTTYGYDALNRVINRSYTDGTPTVSYSYDPNITYGKGRLASVSSSSSATNYTAFDAMGRVTAGNQITDGQTYSMTYGYDLAGNKISMSYPSGRVIETGYDATGRMAGVKDQASGTYYAGAVYTDATNRLQYAPHGAVAVMKLGNGLWEHTEFNNRLQATQIGLGSSSTDSSTLSLTHSYGTTTNNGNLQSVTYAGGGLSYTQTFGYDELNRLTTSSESGSSWSQTNLYDRYGNRWVAGGLSFSTSTNRITTAGYSYDGAGNLINDSTQSFVYDAENKIKTVSGEGEVYRYDGDGNRVRKNFSQGEKVRMVYSGGQLIAEYDLSNSLKKEYVYGAKGLIATIEPSAVIKYTTADHLGTPRVVTSSTGSVISRHDYQPFGEELGSGIGGRTTGMGFSVADGGRQKFTSKERDIETGLDYFGARYYASTQGRFSGTDPIPVTKENFLNPQRWNLYAYVNNNPLSAVDPSGGDGQGKGGDKVISVFLDITVQQRGRLVEQDPKTGRVTRELGPNPGAPWQETKAEASRPGSGYRLDLYGPAEITGENSFPNSGASYKNALKTSDLVFYVGHGRGDTSTSPFQQEGIKIGSSYFTPNGEQLGNLTQGKPDALAPVVGNISCNADRNGGAYVNFVGKNQIMVTLNSNWNGVTGVDAVEKAAHAFVKTYIKTHGNVEKATAAANKVLRSIPGEFRENEQDKVEKKRVN